MLPLLAQKFTDCNSILDLSKYPLNKLSAAEFNELVNRIRSDARITQIDLSNCGLHLLSVLSLTVLLSDLPNVQRLNLSDNKLSYDRERLAAVHMALSQLPNLHFLSLSESTQQAYVSEYWSGLSKIPALRIYTIAENTQQLRFLTNREIGKLIDTIKKDPQQTDNYLKQPGLFDRDLFNNISVCMNFALLYRREMEAKPVALPAQIAEMLPLIEQSQAMNIPCIYDKDIESFVYDLNTKSNAEIQGLTLLLQAHLPPAACITLMLPEQISTFTSHLLYVLKETHPQMDIVSNTEIAFAKLNPSSELEDDYAVLQGLNNLFSQVETNDFYNLLADEERLLATVQQLKEMWLKKDGDLNKLIKAFFIDHHLCQIPVINSNSPPNESSEGKIEFELALLNFEHSAITAQFEAAIEQANSTSTREALQAKAWWGKAIFHTLHQDSDEGIYWYGRFLHEFPKSAVGQAAHSPHTPQESGLYWIRYAAHLKNQNAYTYLSSITQTHASLLPTDKYQLSLACEELRIPLQIGEHFVPYTNTLKLIPASGTWQGFCYWWETTLTAFPKEDQAPHLNAEFARFRQTYPQARKTNSLLIDAQFYLFSLLSDNLLTDKNKIDLVNRIWQERGKLIDRTRHYSYHLRRYIDQLKIFHTAPLSMPLNSRLLLVVRQFLKANPIYLLNSTQAMETISESQRIGAFCKLIEKELIEYLQKGTLFNAKIDLTEPPSYVAVLFHNLITHSLNHFQLNDTAMARELHEVMQEIKGELQEHFFRKTLVNQPNSLGLEKAMAHRFISYSTTAYVANSAQLSLLKKFGDKHTEEEQAQDWLQKGNKVLHATALTFETMHVALPIILAITAGPIPAALGGGGSMIIKNLFIALKKIHHGAEVVDHLLHHYKRVPDTILGLAHMAHLAHEAGLLSHGHHGHSHSHIEIDTIKHFNELLLNASVRDIDNISVLMRHWSTIYQPISDQLTETSNTLLGVLLVELLMRGLTLRLVVEKNNMLMRKQELPNTIAGLLDYFNETLWLYSYPSISDDAQLVTKDHSTYSALNIIFPQRLRCHFANQLIDVAIAPKYTFECVAGVGDVTGSRFASAYEVRQMVRARSNISAVFHLVDGGHSLLNLEDHKHCTLNIAYQESNTLLGQIAFLTEKAEFMQLDQEASRCRDFNKLIQKKIKKLAHLDEPVRDAVLTGLKHFHEKLLTISVLLGNFMAQQDKPEDRIEELKRPEFLNSQFDLSIKVMIKEYLHNARALIVLMNRLYELKIEPLKYLPLDKLDSSSLRSSVKRLVDDLGAAGLNLLPAPDIQPLSTNESSIGAGGFFAAPISRATEGSQNVREHAHRV